MNPEIKIEVGNITYQKTSLNSIEVQVPTCVKIEVSKKENINGIKGIEISNEELSEVPSLVIYYVKEGDSLWKIAKKYRTTVEDIMKYNDLKDDKIYTGDQLMIAKRSKCKAVELL
jgi:LysM repeat protein